MAYLLVLEFGCSGGTKCEFRGNSIQDPQPDDHGGGRGWHSHTGEALGGVVALSDLRGSSRDCVVRGHRDLRPGERDLSVVGIPVTRNRNGSSSFARDMSSRLGHVRARLTLSPHVAPRLGRPGCSRQLALERRLWKGAARCSAMRRVRFVPRGRPRRPCFKAIWMLTHFSPGTPSTGPDVPVGQRPVAAR